MWKVLFCVQEEDLEINMNFDRRRIGLETKMQLLSEALEKQKKTKDGRSMAINSIDQE